MKEGQYFCKPQSSLVSSLCSKCILLNLEKLSQRQYSSVISQYQNGLNNNSLNLFLKKNGKNAGDSFVVLKEAWITNKKIKV